MKNFLSVLIVSLMCISSFGQNKKFDKLLKRSLKKTVPILKIKEVNNLDAYLFLDARESKEFETSHIRNSKNIGFDNFDLKKTIAAFPNKSKAIVIYCSIGIRSEIIGEKLIKAGYTNIYNLYGGIFEWKNQLNIVVDSEEKPTENVHTFSKEWSRWLQKGKKIYEK